MSAQQGGKTKHLRKHKVTNKEDRLSQLPDDIVIDHILGLLPMKEAGRSTILGRRWRSIRTPILEFIPEPNLLRNKIAKLKWKKGKGKRKRKREEERVAIKAVSQYADWVNRVISAKSAQAGGGGVLPKFSLHMPFIDTKDLRREVNSWLTFALGDKGTEALELCFYVAHSSCPSHYEFPSIESQPSLFPRLQLLKSLKLKSVSIRSQTLNYLLQRCELLERLHLEDIYSLDKIEITGAVSRLKYIHLFQLSFLWQEIIPVVISASTPDLISLRFQRDAAVTLTGHAPQLTDLSICTYIGEDGFYFHSEPLSCYISQIQSLHLDICYWTKMIYWLHGVPDLSGLKHLTLTLNYDPNFSMPALGGIISLINSASRLQHLTLDLSHMGLKRKDFRVNSDEPADLRLQFLQVLEFVNFVGIEMERSTVEYMIKGVKSSLHRLILESRPQPFMVECPPEDELERWRTCVVKPILPPEAELIVIKEIHDYDNY